MLSYRRTPLAYQGKNLHNLHLYKGWKNDNYLFSCSIVWPNVVTEWLTLLLHIWEVHDSNLKPETSYPGWEFLLLS
jgi:hypothetical protein